jgi:hypothetical protein
MDWTIDLGTLLALAPFFVTGVIALFQLVRRIDDIARDVKILANGKMPVIECRRIHSRLDLELQAVSMDVRRLAEKNDIEPHPRPEPAEEE